MREAIWDKTGVVPRQLAWIEDGKLFDATTEKQVGTTREGNLYSLNGKFLGGLELAGHVQASGSKTPDALMKLLKVPSGD